jgi:hypothetical protein
MAIVTPVLPGDGGGGAKEEDGTVVVVLHPLLPHDFCDCVDYSGVRQ